MALKAFVVIRQLITLFCNCETCSQFFLTFNDSIFFWSKSTFHFLKSFRSEKAFDGIESSFSPLKRFCPKKNFLEKKLKKVHLSIFREREKRFSSPMLIASGSVRHCKFDKFFTIVSFYKVKNFLVLNLSGAPTLVGPGLLKITLLS